MINDTIKGLRDHRERTCEHIFHKQIMDDTKKRNINIHSCFRRIMVTFASTTHFPCAHLSSQNYGELFSNQIIWFVDDTARPRRFLSRLTLVNIIVYETSSYL